MTTVRCQNLECSGGLQLKYLYAECTLFAKLKKKINKKKMNGTLNKKTEAETLFCNLHVPSILYAWAITSTRSNTEGADNTRCFQEWKFN